MNIDIIAITLALMLLDIVFGFAGAVKEQNVQSEVLREGLWHKAGYIGLITLAFIIEIAARRAELGFEVPSLLVVCPYIIFTEAVSIFENLCILNPKIINSPLASIFNKTEVSNRKLDEKDDD